MPDVTIDKLSPEALGKALPVLAEVLHAAVKAGASIHFVEPFGLKDAQAYWQEAVLPLVESGARVFFAARLGGEIVGTVQLHVTLPPNQAHRCEVTKLIVHPKARNKGIARKLMAALEDDARARGKTLITLDTRTGDMAEPLYSSLGYITAGQIPGFARDVREERFDATTYMYKAL